MISLSLENIREVTEKVSTKRYISYLAAALVLTAGIVLGGFFDHHVAGFMYSGHPVWAVITTVIGLYIFDGSFVLLFGAICRQFFESSIKRSYRINAIAICGILAFITATCGAKGLWSGSVLGLYVDSGLNNIPASILTGLIIFFPLFPLGFYLNGKNFDKDTRRKLIILTSVLAIAFFTNMIVKHTVMRPRYRITLEGFEGIGFVPLFSVLENGKALMEQHALRTDDLASFYSGHALDAALNLIIFPSLALFIPRLKGKENVLTIAATLVCIPILLSRMVLGDHYLSDISFGALVGLIFCFIYLLLVSPKPRFPGR